LLRKDKKGKAALPAGQVRDVYIKETDAQEALGGRKEKPSLGPMQDKALVSSVIKDWVRESR
jgi:hypothetical protein